MDANDILEKHFDIKLPSFPDDDDFSDWVIELIELDAYYVGLASSLMHNGERKDCDFNAYYNLKERLPDFKDLTDDREVYRECELYLDSLEKVVGILQDRKLL